MEKRKTIYTGIKPTGILNLGNFIGVGKALKEYEEKGNLIVCVADLHALTIGLRKEELEDYTYGVFAFYLALGLDPEKTILYVQSQVKAHSEIAWVLNNFTMFGEASRMTQFKDYQAKMKEINAGLFCYPMLMAGDILLYDTDIVPVGIDQKQHVELTRDIAFRFNNKIAPTFVVPEIYVPKLGAKIYGLLEPDKKMSKSERGDTGTIFFEDSEEEIRKKIKRAVTDSDSYIKYDPENKKGISNLLTIYSSMKGISIEETEKYFAEKRYGELKEEVANAIIERMKPVQDRYFKIKNDKDYMHKIMKLGAKKATEIADKKIKEVYEKLGLVQV